MTTLIKSRDYTVYENGLVQVPAYCPNVNFTATHSSPLPQTDYQEVTASATDNILSITNITVKKNQFIKGIQIVVDTLISGTMQLKLGTYDLPKSGVAVSDITLLTDPIFETSSLSKVDGYFTPLAPYTHTLFTDNYRLYIYHAADALQTYDVFLTVDISDL